MFCQDADVGFAQGPLAAQDGAAQGPIAKQAAQIRAAHALLFEHPLECVQRRSPSADGVHPRLILLNDVRQYIEIIGLVLGELNGTHERVCRLKRVLIIDFIVQRPQWKPSNQLGVTDRRRR